MTAATSSSASPAPPPFLGREHRRRQFLRAALVGVLAGAAALLFQLAVQGAQTLGRGWGAWARAAGLWGTLPLVAATAGLGAAAAWLTGRFAPEAGGSGIPHVKAALLSLRVIRPLRLVLVKFVGGFLALAAGMSLGREGPTIQIGAAAGQFVGKALKVRRRSMPALVAAGGGAGLAAAFNAPLAGFVFVMEELKREMSALTYGAALAASVCAVAALRLAAGQEPSFSLADPGAAPLKALPLVALVGAAGGLFGVLFNKTLLAVGAARTRLRVPRWAAGAALGALGGLALVFAPQLTGTGHDVAQRLLAGRFEAADVVLAAFVLACGKLLFTALSYGTGVPGGIFAPILMMGAAFGLAAGTLLAALLPGAGVSPSVFATIGMVAVLAGSVRAPLTGVVLIVEMTGEYGLLYALLLGAFAAYLAAEAVRDKPIYDKLLDLDVRRDHPAPPPEGGAEVLEALVEPGSAFDGRVVADLGLGPHILLATVQRGGRSIVPHGGTLILAGDELTLVVEATATPETALRLLASTRAGGGDERKDER